MRLYYFVAFFLLATSYSSVDAFKSYSKYQLWRLRVTNNEQIARLIAFNRKAYQQNINFWSEEFRTNAPVCLQQTCFKHLIT